MFWFNKIDHSEKLCDEQNFLHLQMLWSTIPGLSLSLAISRRVGGNQKR